MSQRQRLDLDKVLREAPLDLGGDVHQQRAVFAEMMRAAPLPGDVTTLAGTLGGVPVVNIGIAGGASADVVFYLHGGAYAIGSAELSGGLASELARRSRSRAVSVDYRLAPEHPYPAAVEDAIAAYAALVNQVPHGHIAIAGESAGAGLVAATLLALKAEGLRLPAAAVLMSPWADLTLSGDSISRKAPVDPVLTPDGLRRRARDYVAGHDLADGLVSPVFGDLRGLPPLLIQAGSHEILLDDSIRLSARAGGADVPVTLQITPQVPHVFQGFASMLDEGDAALTAAAAFLRSHLDQAQAASSSRVQGELP